MLPSKTLRITIWRMRISQKGSRVPLTRSYLFTILRLWRKKMPKLLWQSLMPSSLYIGRFFQQKNCCSRKKTMLLKPLSKRLPRSSTTWMMPLSCWQLCRLWLMLRQSIPSDRVTWLVWARTWASRICLHKMAILLQVWLLLLLGGHYLSMASKWPAYLKRMQLAWMHGLVLMETALEQKKVTISMVYGTPECRR